MTAKAILRVQPVHLYVDLSAEAGATKTEPENVGAESQKKSESNFD